MSDGKIPGRPTLSVETAGKTKRELAVELLIAFKWILFILLLVALVGVYLLQPELPDVEIPRSAKVFAVAALLAGAVGALPISKAIDWLYDPPRRYLVRPGFTVGEAGIWEMSPAAFEELDVVAGQLYQWPNTEYPTYEVRDYDPENHRALATWRGSASDGELLDREQELDEVRDVLEAKARERDVLVTRAERIVRENVMANTRTLLQEYNRTSIIDVEDLQEDLDQAMQDVSLEGDLERFRLAKQRPETEPDDPRHKDEKPVAEPDTGPSEGQEVAADGGQ